MTTNAATTLLFTTTVARMFDFYSQRSTFVNMIKNIDAGLRVTVQEANAKELQIINRSVTYTRRLTLVFWGCALVTANTMCFNTLMEGFRKRSLDTFNSSVRKFHFKLSI